MDFKSAFSIRLLTWETLFSVSSIFQRKARKNIYSSWSRRRFLSTSFNSLTRGISHVILLKSQSLGSSFFWYFLGIWAFGKICNVYKFFLYLLSNRIFYRRFSLLWSAERKLILSLWGEDYACPVANRLKISRAMLSEFSRINSRIHFPG